MRVEPRQLVQKAGMFLLIVVLLWYSEYLVILDIQTFNISRQVWPAPFGRDLTKEEAYIQKLDGSTGASLKLTVLNPEGRVWTMVAGGGASVVYSDAIAAHGFAHELANYGEYSGAPSEGQTYEYAKTIS